MRSRRREQGSCSARSLINGVPESLAIDSSYRLVRSGPGLCGNREPGTRGKTPDQSIVVGFPVPHRCPVPEAPGPGSQVPDGSRTWEPPDPALSEGRLGEDFDNRQAETDPGTRLS